MISASTLHFLEELKTNNHRDWFLTHKKEYEAAKSEFSKFVAALISGHGSKDPSIAHLTPKDCLFRINRDVRFSKDKSPYKTNFGASINAGGKKSTLAGYYFHLEAGGSFVGGGIYMPDSSSLAKVRQEIDYNWEEFEKILQNSNFKKTYTDLDQSNEFKLQRIPKGYENENPASEYLKLKSYIALKNLTDEQVLDQDLFTNTLKSFEALQTLLEFLNRSFS